MAVMQNANEIYFKKTRHLFHILDAFHVFFFLIFVVTKFYGFYIGTIPISTETAIIDDDGIR